MWLNIAFGVKLRNLLLCVPLSLFYCARPVASVSGTDGLNVSRDPCEIARVTFGRGLLVWQVDLHDTVNLILRLTVVGDGRCEGVTE